ncbi:U3 small nucleolar RNA-associated protein 15 [Balamuthia mandrillaris]
MAGQYRKVEIQQFPALPGRDSAEARHWKEFKFPILLKQHAAVTHVEFSPVEPYNCAVTSSTRVQIFSPTTHTITKTISRFKDIAYSASYRGDGKLMVAGGELPDVKIFDLSSRAILRIFKGHIGPVHVTKFSPDNVHVFSASDDKTARVWDLPVEKEIQVLEGHEDYIRCGAVVASSPDLWVTGSYDHTVKVWDTRQNKVAVNIDHGDPVEAVIFFPSGGIAVTAGSNNVMKVWDILGGGRLLHSVSNHQKAITTLAFNGDYTRLISGSLDQHLKIYDVADYSVVHSIKYSAPILSSALSADNTQLVTGMADGMLSIRHRQISMSSDQIHKRRAKALHGGTYRYFMRGKNEKPSKEDFIVEHQAKQKLQEYDKYLRKFQYRDALDAALETKDPVVVYSILRELRTRHGLSIAVSGRDEIALQPLLEYLNAHITNPRYAQLLIHTCNLVLDQYMGVIGQSIVTDEMLYKLQRKLKNEIRFEKQLFELMGSLDMLISSAAVSSASPNLASS